MPTSPENLAMFESDWPGADWNRGNSARLPGPRRDGGLAASTPGRLAKFHAPEIVFGPPIPPTVMVPSTSGTGADVSQFAIVTDTAARNKVTIISRHGLLNAVLLPHVIRFNAETSPERFVPLAAACGVRTEGGPAAEAALRLADAVRELADELGVPKGLAELGVTDDLIPQLARTTLKDACLATNPRAAGAPDIEALFRAAL